MRPGFASKIPIVSLLLLLFAYLIFGGFLLSLSPQWIVWLLAIAWVFILTAGFILPGINFERLIYRWLQSDAIAFCVLVLTSALISIALVWLHITLLLLLVVAAEALMRLDLRRANFNEPESFCLLVITSFAGFGLALAVKFG